MKKNGFTLIEIIVSVGLLAIVIISFFIFSSKSNKKEVIYTETEKKLLNAADVLINLNHDSDNNSYINQLNIGAQGVKIRLSKLLNEGVIDEKILLELQTQLKKEGKSVNVDEIKNYYILILNGYMDEDNGDKCNGLSYYVSWQEGFTNGNKTLYLCGNLPNGETPKSANVFIKEENKYDETYKDTGIRYFPYDDFFFKILDEDNNQIPQNSDDTYTLEYGKKYHFEFSDSAIENNILLLNYSQESFIYITLEHINGTYDTVYYDLRKVLEMNYKKPSVKLETLKNKLGTSDKNASELLNYNDISTKPLKYKIVEENGEGTASNSKEWCYSTDYFFDEDKGVFVLSGEIICTNYTKLDKFFVGKYTLQASDKKDKRSYLYYLQEDITTNTTSGKFKSIVYKRESIDSSGFYKAKDNDGNTYFFRGNVDNYVLFHGYLWRIIRINGDGTFRVILDGDIGTSEWNLDANTNFLNSTIKTKLDDWLHANLPYYYNIMKESSFCNDNSQYSSDSVNSGKYKAYTRITSSTPTPTFNCDNDHKIKSKIGLITADEMMFAGASYNKINGDYYLAYDKSFWTMTPFLSNYSKNKIFISNLTGEYNHYFDSNIFDEENNYYENIDECMDSGIGECQIYTNSFSNNTINRNLFSYASVDKKETSIYSVVDYHNYLDDDIFIRPVINLNSNVLVEDSGTGTYGNPYVINEDKKEYDYMCYFEKKGCDVLW